MEGSCWSPDNCQVVPSSSDNRPSPLTMDSPIDHDVGYCASFNDTFDNFDVDFDDMFGNFIEKPKSIDAYTNDVNLFNSATPLDQPITVKTEQADVSYSPSCTMFNQTCHKPPTVDSLSMTDLCRTSATVGVSGASEDGIELYHDLIMRHLVKDIRSTCDRLKIPSDPRCWSIHNTQNWLIDMEQQYHLSGLPYEHLTMPGHSLCNMGLEALKHVYPNGGELVHAQLNLWTTASDYSTRHHNVQQSAHLPLKTSIENGCFPNAWTSVGFPAPAETQMYPSLVRYPKNEMKCDQRMTMMPIASPQGFGAFLPSPSSDSGISTDMEEYNDCDPLSPVSAPHSSNNIHLWQFLRELLDNHDKYSLCVRWIDRSQGIFKIEDSHKLAKLWGQRKNRPAMNYDKLSRSLRQYYKKGILKKTPRSQRLVYQFLPPYHIC